MKKGCVLINLILLILSSSLVNALTEYSFECPISHPTYGCIRTFEYCLEVFKSSEGIDQCFRFLAIFKKNPSICENFSFPSENERNLCYSSYAKATQNESACLKIDKLTEIYSDCLAYIGFKRQDSSICDSIEEERNRDICFAKVSYEKRDFFSYCKVQPKLSLDRCFATVAALENDYTICKYISDRQERDKCYGDYASRLRNSEIMKVCNLVESGNDARACKYHNLRGWNKDLYITVYIILSLFVVFLILYSFVAIYYRLRKRSPHWFLGFSIGILLSITYHTIKYKVSEFNFFIFHDYLIQNYIICKIADCRIGGLFGIFPSRSLILLTFLLLPIVYSSLGMVAVKIFNSRLKPYPSKSFKSKS